MIAHKVELIYVLISLFGTVCSFGIWPTFNKPQIPHIIGGEKADIADFPYQVSLRKRGEPYGHGHLCGASILDETHVLTAAHCIARPNIPLLYYVVANSTKLANGVSFTVEKIKLHDEYQTGNPFQYDVAILKLKESFFFGGSANMKPVPLVPVGNEPAPGSNVVVAGWGRTILGNKRPDKDYSDLMKLNLQIVDRDSCNECFGGEHRVTERLLCAGVESSEKKDASKGDSGGPLIDTSTGYQVGIVTFGDERSTKLCPGVYTNLADRSVREFIDETLKTL